ncbi:MULTISPECIES: ABC transporter substrate-binding protein [unclassified Chelatococcus]|uniref:ABC transporter substrate-binding protein n=1 Tax=unclassified Chelatococcus TaxID=2638111 RepID=UPI001BCC3074|nr:MULTISPECIES: ABC transporter substrate-binding protein [unclassified Chelatococcus]MBS7701363.1 ABC transporter substrate-binding protein [Chelatococcus sp. YT9]MBX3557443.1 ABC transporter substrate-binding protein [Chelatococcus sp.]
MKPTRRMLTAGTAVMALLGLTGAPVLAQQEAKIGVVAAQSGPAAQWGIAARKATEFAVAEANRDNLFKIDGKPVKLSVVSIDGKYTVEGAAAGANTLASQGVKIVIGGAGSPEVTGMKPIATRNNMLLMVSSYAKNAIGPQWPLVFHMSPGPSVWADPIIKVAKEKFKFDSVVIVAPNDQGGTDIASVNAEAFRANGVKATEEYYQRGTTNFAPIVTRIMNANPGSVDLASSPPGDAGTLVKQLRQAGFQGAIGRLGGPGYSEISRIAGGDAVLKDFYWFEPIVIDDNTRKLDSDYKALMGEDRPENNLFYQWVISARMVVKAAIEAQSVTDTAKIAEILRKMPVSDQQIGDGYWVGQKFFGINQELSFPFGMGVVSGGTVQPVTSMPAARE